MEGCWAELVRISAREDFFSASAFLRFFASAASSLALFLTAVVVKRGIQGERGTRGGEEASETGRDGIPGKEGYRQYFHPEGGSIRSKPIENGILECHLTDFLTLGRVRRA